MLTRRKLIDVKKLLKGEGSDHKTAKDNLISPNTSTCDNDKVSRLRDRDKIKPRKRELPEENLQSASNGKKAKRKKFKKHQPYSHTEEFLKKQASKIKDQIKLVQKWKKMGGKRIQNELKQGSRKRKSTAKTKGKSNNNQKQKERRKEISVKSRAKSKIIRKKNTKKSIENTATNAKEDNLKSNDNTDVESDDNDLMDVDTENELQKQPFNHTEQALKKKGQDKRMQEQKKIKLIQQQKQKDRKTRSTKASAKSRIIKKYHKYKKPHQPQEPLDLPVYDEMYSEGTQVMFGVFQELALLKTCSVFVQLKYRGTCQYFGTHHAIDEYKTIGLKRKPDDFNIIQHRDGPRLYRGIYYELPNASAEPENSQILKEDDETTNHDDQHTVKENILGVNNEEVDVKDNQQKTNVVLNESKLNMNDNIDISTTDQSKAENKAADNGLNNSYYGSTEMSNAYHRESESDEIIGDFQADINDPMGKSVEEIVTEAKNNFSSDNNTAVDDSDYMENDTEESFTEGRTEESLKELIEDSLIKTANEIAKKSYRQKHHRNFSKDKYSQAMASHSHRMKPKSLNSTEPRSCGYTASVLESDIPSIPKSLKFKLQNKGKFVVTQPFSVTEFLKSKKQKSKKKKKRSQTNMKRIRCNNQAQSSRWKNARQRMLYHKVRMQTLWIWITTMISLMKNLNLMLILPET
ncbi:unnamed protein product [Owenia fusiformis]|uniref:Uncharacterized protein n=1 Tax=Owenia fusiformis TaxID=6347 RepID=A0A8S4PSE6_OWEFU|nr:unnamed protein product [Owenia fusiformis]